MFQYFHLANQLVGEIISCIGWPMVVTGQSFVLYSRLGVVLGPSHQRILRAVKWMIIVDGVVFHVSTQVVMFGAYNAHPNHGFAEAYKYVEKIQMTGFTVQEFILSGLYVWRTLDILKTSQSRRRTRIMHELLAINAFIILMDIALLVIEYQNRHVMEQALKGLIYSVKLKLEFAILSKLVGVTQKDEGTSSGVLDDYDYRETEEPQNGSVVLPPFQSDSQKEKINVDEGPVHIERASSWLSGTTFNTPAEIADLTSLPSNTSEELQKRQTLEQDLYADAMRSVAGRSPS